MVQHGLQQLQKRAARIILRRDSSNDTFKVLEWADLEINRKIHKCVLVSKCLYDLVSQYLSNYFIGNSSLHIHYTRRKSDFHLPKPELSLTKRTFRYSGSVLFNSLPAHIKHATFICTFKSLLTNHFKNR